MGWREGYVAGGDTRFFVRALGHGPDLVLLLHGWPEDGSSWRGVAPLLEEAGWRVACPDLKGFGRSSSPHSGYDRRTLADEVARLIANLHVRRAVIVGHDWGGAVALATALRHPGRVRSVIVSNAPYRQLDLRRSWQVTLFNLPIVPEVLVRLDAERVVRTVVAYGAKVPEAFDDDVISAYAQAIRARGWLSYYRTLSRRAVVAGTLAAVRRRLPGGRPAATSAGLRVPVHVVWGEDDPLLPSSLGRQMADDLGASFASIPAVGHFPHEEDPLAFARAVLASIGSADEGERTAVNE